MSQIETQRTAPQKPAVDSIFRFALGSLFFCSGAVALVYEAAWQREFTLLFGSAAPATAAVLAGYFAGIGLGSYLLGKWGGQWGRPLLVYAALEILIGIGALLVNGILALYSEMYPDLFARFNDGGGRFLLVKGVLAFAAIALPTMAMGGTLPVLAQLFKSQNSRLGEWAGWLYMLNTAGAAAGVLAFPSLLGAIGMRRSIQLCVIFNLAIAAISYLLQRRRPAVSVREKNTTQESQGRKSVARRGVVLAFVSGFVTFSLQVGWNRAFAQIHENSLHSFSLIVALFIAAIAAGAQLARWFLRRGTSYQKALGKCWIAGGLLTIAAPLLFIRLSDGLRFVPAENEGMLFNTHLLIPALVVILGPVVLISVSLPILLEWTAATSKGGASNVTGTLLAANIVGCVSGALGAGFLIPRVLGMWGTIVIPGTMLAVAGGALLLKTMPQRIFCVAGSLLIAGWVLRADLPRTRIEQSKGERLIGLAEGAHGIAAVTERSGSRRLKLNNHYVLGGTAATGDERMQGHIPMLVHPDAGSAENRVVFLGVGTGITAGAAFFHNVSHVSGVELVPEVTRLAHDFFSEANRNFGLAPGSRLVIEDARNYLRGTRERFDLIVGDLVVPWRVGEGALYTIEHFQAARARLNERGIYCCWLPLFQLGREEFELIARTFLQVFPKTYLWRGDFSPTEPAVALVGYSGGDMDTVAVRARLSQLQPDPSNPHLKHPQGFYMHLAGILEPDAFPGKQVNSENQPVIELRRARPKPFVGRDFAEWENGVRVRSWRIMEKALDAEARVGWKAGQMMVEFTLLMSEGNRAEATRVEQQLRVALGAEIAQSILGP